MAPPRSIQCLQPLNTHPSESFSLNSLASLLTKTLSISLGVYS